MSDALERIVLSDLNLDLHSASAPQRSFIIFKYPRETAAGQQEVANGRRATINENPTTDYYLSPRLRLIDETDSAVIDPPRLF
ncbi:hypothetical protein GEV33_013287 [Tenebrio molitor]|uniref:Uncharacterized protein n=1 Tax=Tenebrio molitor TaxID=7067 RepID=A0A8J6H7K1_TENMO|nr:hypothetical protein GEV33_013287 [Tenebrio molitor]